MTETADPRFHGEQPTAPYLDAVVAHGFRGTTRFNVPGHKGGPGADSGLRHALGDDVFALDLPQDLEGIDLGAAPTPYERAEQLAAEAYGAGRTWFLTNGATQGNHALCLALAPLGAEVVVQRNSHASVVDGLVLSGGRPSFVAPAYDEGLGMAHGVTTEALAQALAAAPEARAAFIVSPTYYGMAADVAGCARVDEDEDRRRPGGGRGRQPRPEPAVGEDRQQVGASGGQRRWHDRQARDDVVEPHQAIRRPVS